MIIDPYLRGVAIGFAIAFALGPVGLLVIRRTVDRGWAYGFVSGVGVATADAAYAAMAAFGLTALSGILVGIDRLLGIAGGAVLLLLAVHSLRSTRARGVVAARPEVRRLEGPLAAWASMIALTATNPATILGFAALFASLGAGTAGPAGAMAVVLGVFTGSVAWWAMLTGITAGMRTRLSPRAVRRLNIGSAGVIGAFGGVAIWLGLTG